MKSLILVTSLIIFFSSNAYAALNCKNVQKTSPKYLLCKTGSGLSSIKNKLSNKRESKKEAKKISGKKSIFKKFGEAKSLSDLK